VRNATDILWYRYHENESVYRDGDGEWSVVFETRCRNLAPDLLCSIYEHRPEICREFDNKTCEVNDPEGGLAITTPPELLDYLRVRRPNHYEKVTAKFVPPQGFPALSRTASGG
jgi:Fe-S-cluster containining protein